MSEARRDIIIPDFVKLIVDEFDARRESFPSYELTDALKTARREQKELSQQEQSGYWAEAVACLG